MGIATETPLARPEGLLLDEASGFLYVADTGNGLVRRVELANGRIETIAGSLTSVLPPSTVAAPALTVDLGRPVGLALDTEQTPRLFVADPAAGQVLEVTLSEPRTVRSLLAPEVGFHPAKLAFHRFSTGAPVLFVADLGRYPGASGVRPPALYTVDLNLKPVAQLEEVPLTFNPEGRYDSFRAVADIAADRRADGSTSLFVAADLGEEFETYVTFTPPGAVELGFELDCGDSLDDDNDGLVDDDDPDCRLPVQALVLRYDFASDGSNLGAPGVALFARGFRRFPIEEASFPFPDCSPPTVLESPPLDFPELVPLSLALARPGVLLCVDVTAEEVLLLDPGAQRQTTMFGSSFELASPSDGASPRVTKLNLPRAIWMDSLANLFVADTVHNRIRRAWIGDLLGL